MSFFQSFLRPWTSCTMTPILFLSLHVSDSKLSHLFLHLCIFFNFFFLSELYALVKWKSLSPVWLFANHGLQNPWNSAGQNTGVGSCSLLQRIFPTQGSNPCLPHCRWILYQLGHKESPFMLLSNSNIYFLGYIMIDVFKAVFLIRE